MKFTIVHLYHDLMNLYGASGNIKVLTRYLESQGLKVKVVNVTIGDELDYENADLIYMGSGTETSQELARQDIQTRKELITKYIDDEKFFYAEGNSLELLCNSINGKEALGIYDYDVVHKERIREQVSYESSLLSDTIYGFVNCNTLIEKNELVEYGFVKNNLIASYLLGPIFARNPYFTEWYVARMLKHLELKNELDDFNNALDHKAFEEFCKLLND